MKLSPATIELREKAAALFKQAHDLVEGKNDDDDLTPEMKSNFDKIMADAREADAAFGKAAAAEGVREELRDRFSYYHEAATGRGVGWQQIASVDSPKSFGQQWVESKGYKDLMDSGYLRSDRASFRTEPLEMKAPSDLIHTVSGGPASGLVLPQFLPGIIPLNQRPLTVRALFANAPTTSDLIDYAFQSSFDNGAAAVAQATSPSGATNAGTGLKPQSSIAWDRDTRPVQTLATWMAVTRQTLADAGQVAALIDNQGRLMLQLEEEDQLLDGNGTAPNLRGLLHTPGVQTLDLTGFDNLDGIRSTQRMIRTGASRMRADGIVLHPVDSEMVDLLKDGIGQYRGGNPIGGGFQDLQPIWRMRRVESEAVSPGTAIVGAFGTGATVLERQGITVYTTDSHEDFFVKNLVVVLFEERLGFAVYYPSAFVVVTLADWFGGSGSGAGGVISGS